MTDESCCSARMIRASHMTRSGIVDCDALSLQRWPITSPWQRQTPQSTSCCINRLRNYAARTWWFEAHRPRACAFRLRGGKLSSELRTRANASIMLAVSKHARSVGAVTLAGRCLLTRKRHVQALTRIRQIHGHAIHWFDNGSIAHCLTQPVLTSSWRPHQIKSTKKFFRL